MKRCLANSFSGRLFFLYSAMALAGNLAHLVYSAVFHALQSTILGVFMRQLCVSRFLTGLLPLRYLGRYASVDA